MKHGRINSFPERITLERQPGAQSLPRGSRESSPPSLGQSKQLSAFAGAPRHDQSCWRNSPEIADVCAQMLADHPLGRLLDAGGGEGFVTAYLMRSRVIDEATVLDQSATVLTSVAPPIVAKCGRLEDIDDSTGDFATILVRQVLHYVKSPVRVLRRLGEHLSANGVIYVGQIVTAEASSARWLGAAAHWTSPPRRRVWTVDSLLTTFALAGLRPEHLVVIPHWQVLDLATGLDNAVYDHGAHYLFPTRRRDGRVFCQVLFLHAILRPAPPMPSPHHSEVDSRFQGWYRHATGNS